MTAILKEEKRVENPAKTYLQSYQEYVKGYQQYKMEQVKTSKEASETYK